MSVSRTTTAIAAGATMLLGRRSRAVSVLAGAACVAASVMTRFGIFEAGLASARDPKYTVVPQRRRLASAEPASTEHQVSETPSPGTTST